MKQKILQILKAIFALLILAGFIYLCYFHLLWIIIPCIVITLVLYIVVSRDVAKREKEVKNYLNDCDEKLKRGEMTKEENEKIHFYWEYGHIFF